MNKPVFTFWYGGDLGQLHLACIRSWLRCGHAVSLYSYESVNNVPDGVQLCDASSIISDEYFKDLIPLIRTERASWQPIVSLSDLLRMKGMELGLGCWLDTDVFLFEPVPYQKDKLHLAWEQTAFWQRKKVGVSIMYIPANNPMVADFLRVLSAKDLMPNWLGFRRKYIKTLAWKLQGLKYRSVDISITAYGNLAVRKLVKRHKFAKDILPKNYYYHWIGKETNRFFTDPLGKEVLENTNCIGIHVHRKHLADAPVAPGSLYDYALKGA